MKHAGTVEKRIENVSFLVRRCHADLLGFPLYLNRCAVPVRSELGWAPVVASGDNGVRAGRRDCCGRGCGSPRACFVYLDVDGSYRAQTDTLDAAVAAPALTAKDYLHLAAGFLGGWAAVHLAVAGGMLPFAPLEIEAVAGDYGYFATDQIYVHWAAVQADARDPVSIVAQARDLALDVLRPRLDQVLELGGLAAGTGLVNEDTVRSTIAR